MENQAVDKEADVPSSRLRCSDRISELPQPLLHHILSFLSQKEAIQTCVLSKPWRHLGSTRPNLEFCHHDYNRRTFLSILNKTLRRYHHQNICLHEFLVEFRTLNPQSASLLEKWIPIIFTTMRGLMTFHLSFAAWDSAYFDLPSALFESECLRNLRLQKCRLNINSIDQVLFCHLQTLSLTQVRIEDTALETIMSSCLFIERVVLDRCERLATIRVSKGHKYLKHFDFHKFIDFGGLETHLCFEIIDAPCLETIKISGECNWYIDRHHRNYMYFPGLKSLYLVSVHLPTRSFNILSRDLPCLQDLSIQYCQGFNELRVASRSIKRLTLIFSQEPVIDKVRIDAQSIVSFVYGGAIPRSISFTTASNEWKTSIAQFCGVGLDHLELYKLLKAVNRSEISLTLYHIRKNDGDKVHAEDVVCDKPVLVEHLRFTGSCSKLSFPNFFISMFRYCRPRNIHHYWYAKPRDRLQWESTRSTLFICKMLILAEGERHRYPWQHDLEGTGMEVLDENSKEWHCVDGTIFSEYAAAAALLPDYHPPVKQVCFKLKWQE